MSKDFRYSCSCTLGIFSFVLTIVPESCFDISYDILNLDSKYWIILNRVIFLLVTASVVFIYILLRRKFFTRSLDITGRNYSITIAYGDIFKKEECKKVIAFDECFTTDVGEQTWQIKPGSICGQYLAKHSDLNIKQLIKDSKIQPSSTKSNFKGKTRYDSGKIVPNGDDLLMAFVKLTEEGTGLFSYEEYLSCLSVMWDEIYKYSSNKDVCIPIVGSGQTIINGKECSKQELLDLIIESYKLCKHKIKLPNKLIIVCRAKDGILLNQVGESF